MKKIRLSLFRKIVAVAIAVVLELLLFFVLLYICTDWFHITKSFVRYMASIIIATPVSIIACKAIIESWTGEKIEQGLLPPPLADIVQQTQHFPGIIFGHEAEPCLLEVGQSLEVAGQMSAHLQHTGPFPLEFQ